MQSPEAQSVRPAGVGPAGLLIRARCRADVDGVTELVNLPGFRFGTARLPFHTPEEVAGWIDKAPATSLNLVAVLGGRIIGEGGLHRLAGRQAHVASLGLGVHDDWTGRGIGTALLSALLDAADNWLGIRRVQLTVFVDNLPAIRLYRRRGFEVEGTHRAYALRDGRYVDAHTMARLGGADPLAAGGTDRPPSA